MGLQPRWHKQRTWNMSCEGDTVTVYHCKSYVWIYSCASASCGLCLQDSNTKVVRGAHQHLQKHGWLLPCLWESQSETACHWVSLYIRFSGFSLCVKYKPHWATRREDNRRYSNFLHPKARPPVGFSTWVTQEQRNRGGQRREPVPQRRLLQGTNRKLSSWSDTAAREAKGMAASGPRMKCLFFVGGNVCHP